MTTKKGGLKRPPPIRPSEIVADLERRYLALMGWAVVNTKDKDEIINALPKEQVAEIKVEIGLRPNRLTPKERLEIKRQRAQGDRPRKARRAGITTAEKLKNPKLPKNG